MALERLKLDGKVAIITGGARGVGRGIASVLSEAGAAIVMTGRTASDLDRAVADLKSKGARAFAVAGDVTNKADNERTVAAALEEFGRIDILINNAGGSPPQPFLEITSESFLQDFRFNVLSAFELTQLAAPHMLAAGGGSVVNISSRSAQFGGKGFTTYSACKAALEQLSKMMAWELAPKIRVNAISLGTIQTEGLESGLAMMGEGARESIARRVPLQRIGDAQSVGLAALYLCSDECYSTASVIRVDGGIIAPLA